MSKSSNEDTTIDDSRSREEKLEALVEKNIDPKITKMAERALEKRRQEDSS